MILHFFKVKVKGPNFFTLFGYIFLTKIQLKYLPTFFCYFLNDLRKGKQARSGRDDMTVDSSDESDSGWLLPFCFGTGIS